jgi:hypothetical protein
VIVDYGISTPPVRPGQAANMKDLLLDDLTGVAAGAAAVTVTGTGTVNSGAAHLGEGEEVLLLRGR